jgi:hypothetical protein
MNRGFKQFIKEMYKPFTTLIQGKTSKEWYEEYTVPNNWWVHGRKGSQILNNDYPTECTKKWKIAEQYSGNNGSMWMITYKNKSSIIDVTNTTTQNKIYKQFIDDYDDNNLNYGDLYDIEKYERIEYNEVERKKRFIESLNPHDIVDSAGFWDNMDFITWFYDRFTKGFIITHDGVVVIDLDSCIAIKVEI